MDRDQQSLLDMLQSARIVMDYIAGQSISILTTDQQRRDALIYRLLIVGEASNRVSPAMQQRLSSIPWVAINGMRNRLIHEYDDVDVDIVWNTAAHSIPKLINALEEFLR